MRANSDPTHIFNSWLQWLETDRGMEWRKANGGNGDDLDRVALIPNPPGAAIFTVADLRETVSLMHKAHSKIGDDKRDSRRITMPITYGYHIEWYPSPGVRFSVESISWDNHLDAILDALKMAILCGYTVPRWWQWWRWFERRITFDGVLEQYKKENQEEQKHGSVGDRVD